MHKIYIVRTDGTNPEDVITKIQDIEHVLAFSDLNGKLAFVTTIEFSDDHQHFYAFGGTQFFILNLSDYTWNAYEVDKE